MSHLDSQEWCLRKENCILSIEEDFEMRRNIKKSNFFQNLFGCNKEKHYRSMLKKSEKSIMKELDLVKFI